MSSLQSGIEYDSLHPRDHARIAEFVSAQAGIQLPDHKRNLIETRLRKRQRVLGYQTLHDYISHALEPNSNETHFLLDALTTNKTEFFREASHYEWFSRYLKEHKNTGVVQVWSAGCSSGEEPYTLSMLGIESQADLRILATDISSTMLNKARKAIYPHKLVTPIPIGMRQRHLLRRKTAEADEIKISPHVRKQIKFSEFNLITGDFKQMPVFDMIFCRNVMIYFNPQQRQELINRFYQHLRPGGLFFIGHSESLKDTDSNFDVLIPTVYQRR